VNHIKQIPWEKAFTSIKQVNEEFYSYLKDVSLTIEDANKRYFYIASFSYGQPILENGILRTPCLQDNSKNVQYTEIQCEKCNIKKILADSPGEIPLALLLDGCAQVFETHEKKRHIIPKRILKPGELFGVFETAHSLKQITEISPSPWSICSGARSVHIQMPIKTDTFRKAVLNELSVYGENPSLYNEFPRKQLSWQKNYKLIQFVSKILSPNWCTNVLFIPRQWIEGDHYSRDILRTFIDHIYVLQAHPILQGSADDNYLLKKGVYDQPFFKYLLGVGRGDLPAFRPVFKTEFLTGPFIDVENLLFNASKSARLHFYPTIFQPVHLKTQGDVGYISIRWPAYQTEREVKKLSESCKHNLADKFHIFGEAANLIPADFNLSDITFFHSGRDEGNPFTQKNESASKTEFIPKKYVKDNITISFADGTFLSVFVRIVRN